MLLFRSLLPLVGIALLLSGCARTYSSALLDRSPHREVSLEELRLLYQKEQEALPPVKGLMEATLQNKKGKVRFWAKWTSNTQGITIHGFNLLGGPLFDFETTREEVHFTTADSKSAFHGSRKEFQHYLAANDKTSKRPLQMEWLTLMDWIARGGIPDLSQAHHAALEKQSDPLILNAFVDSGGNPVLAQKLFIERKRFRVTEAFLFDPDGALAIQIRMSDYRRIKSRLPEPARPPVPDVPSGAAAPDTVSSLADSSGGALFPFHIEVEAGDFYGEAVFMELHAGNAK